jgi:hypothetical protein
MPTFMCFLNWTDQGAKNAKDATRAIRHHRHSLARLRAGDAALRTVPHDLLRGRQGAVALRAQRHDDHACPDAAGAGGDHHLAANSAVPAAPDLAGILALILLTRSAARSLNLHDVNLNNAFDPPLTNDELLNIYHYDEGW